MRLTKITVFIGFYLGLGCVAGVGPESVERTVGAITLPDCSEGAIRAQAPADAAPMLDRAFDWIHRAIPYCQCVSGAVGGYRTDCSGFVSMVWQLAAPGHTTYSFGGGPWDDHVSARISMDALRTGDALNYPGSVSDHTGHIVLFGGWLNDAHTRFCSLEESHTGTPARVIVRSVDPAYLPIRLASRATCAAHCEGSVLVSSDCGRGDCGTFGARCIADGLGARCGFAFCPDTGETDVCWGGSHLGHCSNGQLTSQGDCGVYGAHCVADGLGARCVFAYCPNTGDGDVCWDGTHIGHCSNGRLTSQGDCGAYAAFCSSRGGGARCVSMFCVATRDDAPVAHDACWITGGQRLHCDANGAPTVSSCPAGQSCSMVGGAHCAPSPCPATGESEVCAGPSVIGHCANGSVVGPRECGEHALCSTLSGTAPHCVSTYCVSSASEVPVERSVCLPDGRVARCDGDGSLDEARPCDKGSECVTTGASGQCATIVASDAGPDADGGEIARRDGAVGTDDASPVSEGDATVQGGCGVSPRGSWSCGGWLGALALCVAARRRRADRSESSSRPSCGADR